jgi:3',5'-cyclic AMP phosphodiesterase CpdA
VRTIAHISDIHFGRVDPVVAEGLITDIASLNRQPDVLVMSGDLTQRARAAQYRDAARYMTRLPSPQIVVPGNHDIPLFDVVRRFFFPLDRYRRHITPDLRPCFQDSELLIVGMNSARSWTWSWDGWWKDGRVSEEQLLDVKLRTCHAPPELFKVVVTHHPFIPPPGERPHGIIKDANPALRQLEECGVDMLLAGHLHVGYSGDVMTHHEEIKRSILSVQAGTAISTRRRHEPNAYNVIEIHPLAEGAPHPRVAVHVRAWNGQKFAPLTTTNYQKMDNRWTLQAVQVA